MIRERTLVQHYFSWKEIETAIGKEYGDSGLANCHLIDWHDKQDDYVETGAIGKKHNISKQLADLEKKYAKCIKDGQYQNIPMIPDAQYDGLMIVQMDDHATLMVLRAFVKILGEEYAKSFRIMYDWED